MPTKKPCPGCDEVDPRRSADRCCYACEDKLRTHSRLVQQISEMKGWTEVKLAYAGGGTHEDAQEIINVILAVMPENCYGKRVVPEKFVNVFQELRNKISDLCNENYRLGHSHGSNLLKQLAEGNKSINDFDFHKKSAQEWNR